MQSPYSSLLFIYLFIFYFFFFVLILFIYFSAELLPHILRQIQGLVLTANHLAFSFEPRYEKTCFCHMLTTKTQISLRIRAV